MKPLFCIRILLLLSTFLVSYGAAFSAQQPPQSNQSDLIPIIFSATPHNDNLLRTNQALKNKYSKKLESLLNQGNLQGEANLYCLLGDLENVTGEFRKAEINYMEAESRYQQDKKDNFLELGRVWYGLGEIERKRNQYGKAKKAYKEANRFYNHANSRQGRAAVQLALGHIQRNAVGPEDARFFYELAKELYEGQSGEANVFCALGDLESSLGNYKKSQEAYDKATSLYKTNKNLLGLANVLIGQGNLAKVRNKNSQALIFYEQAAGHYKNIQDVLGRANALTGTADIERKLPAQYHLKKSSKRYVTALGLYTEMENTLGMANVLTGQGYLETLQGNHEIAEKNYLSARRYYEDLGDKLGQANIALGLGRLEVILGKTGSALKRYEQAENMYRTLKNLLGLANALTERGHLQGMLAQTEVDRILVLNIYKEAKGLYGRLKNRLGEAHVLCGVGWLEKKLGRLDEAKTAFKEARCLYGQLQDHQGQDVVDQFLKEIEEKVKEQLARTDAPAKSLNKKEIPTKDTENNWYNVVFSGVGPWITDKIWPFVKKFPVKIWQCIVIFFEGLWGQVLTIITLTLATVYKCLKKRN